MTDPSGIVPPYKDVQAHYDLSDDFFGLFLDPTRTYSCAYFDREGVSLQDAQIAKMDLALGKCELQSGMRLLDVGCGWGSLARRAADHLGVRVVGLTLSRNQLAYAQTKAVGRNDIEFRLQGWEEFNEPVDRIVSIGAMEHFRVERYAAFFERCRSILPSKGKMLLHSIVHGQDGWNLAIDRDLVDYVKFIRTHIFPGGQLTAREVVVNIAKKHGFVTTRQHSLQSHYPLTLDRWAANLEANRASAIAITSQEIYARYMFYLTRSAHYFRTGHIDVVQFSMERAD
jgi:cyclopropane-fatty-acyl-phospholipid synthase